jgi:hypothetical protein
MTDSTSRRINRYLVAFTLLVCSLPAAEKPNWNDVAKIDTVDAYTAFLAGNPPKADAAKAERRIEEIKSKANIQSVFLAVEAAEVRDLRAVLAYDPKLVNARQEDGTTPLHLAVFPWGMTGSVKAYGDYGSLVPLLLERGADPNARKDSGETPLILAAGWRLRSGGLTINGKPAGEVFDALALQAMRLLLQKGADVNAQNKMGITALDAAARRGDLRFVKLLLDAGADPLIKDSSGKTAVDYTESEDVIRLLNTARR